MFGGIQLKKTNVKEILKEVINDLPDDMKWEDLYFYLEPSHVEIAIPIKTLASIFSRLHAAKYDLLDDKEYIKTLESVMAKEYRFSQVCVENKKEKYKEDMVILSLV